MPVRVLIFILLLSPAMLSAKQENEAVKDIEIFEFLALFEEKDNEYIDTEINDVENKDEQSLTVPNVAKSGSDEQ